MKLRPLAVCLAAIGFASLPAIAQIAATALPGGGVVSAGSAAISQAGSTLRIDQTSAKAVIDWQRFNIGREATVQFRQPSAAAIALNRVGADGGRSIIDGHLSANGQVWLLNPGGVLFSPSARVDVGGLLATSLKLGNDDFMRGNIRFTKDGAGSIENQGTLTAADGGYIALLAPEVRNEGIIAARLGTVALASGEELRVDFSGDRLIEIRVDRADVNGLIDNRNLVAADGGWVLMSTDAASRLANGAINNSGIVRATTLSEHQGVIKLLGGTVQVAGTLDASAPGGGDGGFIETSGHSVKVDSATRVTTTAAYGRTGNWLIDPNDYTIAASGGDITGAALSSLLATTNVTIQTAVMGTPGGNGDIFVNAPVSWSSGNVLTLEAERNITINSNVTGTGLNSSFTARAPGILSVLADVTGTGPGGAGGDAINYQAKNLVLGGTTTAIAGTLTIQPYDPFTEIRIESTPSGGLSLTPTQFATLHADADRDIVLSSSIGGIHVLAALADTQIHAGHLKMITSDGQITIDAPITGGPGLLSMGFETLTPLGNVMVNSTLSTPGALTVETAGRLYVTSAGSVSAGGVSYIANTMWLYGPTTSSSASIGLRAFDNSRALRIESTDTSGGLSLSPAAIATLHAPAAHNINIGWRGGGPLTVDAGLDASHVDAGDLHLNGSSVVVNAPITFSTGATGLVFEAGSGGVQINAPISLTNASGWLNFQLSNGGIVRQSSAGVITARQMVATGYGEIDLMYGNRIGTVAADLSSARDGDFALVNDSSTGITVGSVDGVNGITAVNILLYTGGNMALNAPIVAIDGGYGFGLGPIYTVDPLCTAACVQPHIDLRAGGSFSNNVGAGALTLPAGTFWSLITDKPSTTYLNGLTPDAVSYDAASIHGDILLSANRVFYAFADVIPAPAPAPTATAIRQAQSAIVTSDTTVSQDAAASASPSSDPLSPAAIAPAGGIGSGGATMSDFPASNKTQTASTETSASTQAAPSAGTTEATPPPKLIVDASTTVPSATGILQRSDLEAINREVHAARTLLFADALSVLAKDPAAADIPDCTKGGLDLCIAKPAAAEDDGYKTGVRRRMALLIGNNAYRSPIPELDTAINDVTAIAAQLQNRMGYEVRIVENAGRRQTVEALNELIRNTERNDSVLVMYSGHGYLDEVSHVGYWIPTDADVALPNTWISNETIARALRNVPAKQVMLVSDSCYSGSLTREGKVNETLQLNREQTMTRRSVLAFSSGGDEPVSDEGHDNHSIFAWNVIRSLEQMQEETSGQQLHATIKEAVAREFPQVPQYGTVVSAGHAEGGEYLLTPKKEEVR